VNPEDVTLPPTVIDPVSCLGAPRKALQCIGWEGRTCDFISVNEKKMSRHCNGHGWRSSPEHRKNWKSVMVQSFCPTAQSPRWFVVRSEGEHEFDNDERDDNVLHMSQSQRHTILEGFRTMDE
jgi:hypothetical protein